MSFCLILAGKEKITQHQQIIIDYEYQQEEKSSMYFNGSLNRATNFRIKDMTSISELRTVAFFFFLGVLGTIWDWKAKGATL